MKKIILILVAAVVLMSLAACNKNDDGVIKAPGIVDGDIITLKAVVPGTVVRLDLLEGGTVAKNNTVVEINSDKIKNQLQELTIRSKEILVNRQKITNRLRFLDADIRFLTKQTDRFRRLSLKKAVPGEKLETMELKLSEAASSRFQLSKGLEELDIQAEKILNKQEYLQLLLEDHRISVPVDGLVLQTFIKQGESVFPGTAIADVLDISSLFVEIFIEEQEMAALKLEQKVSIQVDGMPGAESGDNAGTLSGTVSYFGKKAEFSPKYIVSEKERKSLLYQVKIRVKDDRGIIKVGMPVTVILGLNTTAR